MSRKIFTNCGNLLLIWAFSRDDRWARRRSRRRCPTADRCLAGCGGREGREGQMRANDGERTKNGRSQKRGSGTRSVRAHRRRKRGGAVSGGIGCLDQSRSRNRTQGGPPASERRRLGCAREAARRRTGQVVHRFERASIRVSWQVLTEIRLCVREFEPPCARGFRFPQVNRLHMGGLGKKGGQAPSPTADFRKNPPEIASTRAPGSHAALCSRPKWQEITDFGNFATANPLKRLVEKTQGA